MQNEKAIPCNRHHCGAGGCSDRIFCVSTVEPE